MSADLVIDIRQENAADHARVHAVNTRAFSGRDEEAALVDGLRMSEGFVPDLALVACQSEDIVGYVMFTKIALADSQISLALAPLSVDPRCQRKGVGKALVKAGLKRATELGYKSAIVLGHADYYSKFGFQPASNWGITSPFGPPSDAFRAIELEHGSLDGVSGMVNYPQTFFY
ncbi:acyl-CoA N-acyltransferase [Martensiomyces pterosporus]|nr:acyl-CoA N-acyltransferase [Martensiomyces pterosporus]